MLAAGLGVGFVAALGLTVFFWLTGDDGTPATTAPLSTAVSKSTSGTTGGPEPVNQGPANKFTPMLSEMPPDTIIYPLETFSMDPVKVCAKGPDGSLQPATLCQGKAAGDHVTDYLGWATNGLFAKSEEGEAKAREWGLQDAYQASFRPGGLLAAVLQGAYYVTVEVSLFGDAPKAASAYAKYEQTYRDATGSQQEQTKGLGNQSSAWSVVQGSVGLSQTAGVFHRFVFRRGNMVVSVQTFGAQPYMNIDTAREIAVMVDQKALGQRPALTPTPTPTGTPGLPR